MAKETIKTIEAPKAVELTAAQKKEAEDAALKKFCEMAGQDYEELVGRQARKDAEPMVELDLGGQEVHVNGHPYRGRVRVKASLGEVLAHAANAKRRRILEEKIGKEYLVQSNADGGVSSTLVKISENIEG